MTMDFEDFMIEVEQELDALASEQGEEFTSSEMESIMYHLFENGEYYRPLTVDVVAERLLDEYRDERLQLV